MENNFNFATNERAVQEQMEEKVIGRIPEKYYETIKDFPNDAGSIVENISDLMKKSGLPFLGTDRNVLNLPGVGKASLIEPLVLHDMEEEFWNLN